MRTEALLKLMYCSSLLVRDSDILNDDGLGPVRGKD